MQFIVGVAGAGKTTALDAATSALTDGGWTVLGASTSGQAARTLGDEAAIDSRTVASLLWRLDQGQARLDAKTVVVLDEAAMTTDDDLLRLVTAIDTMGARLVLVGDPAQLGAVGPGGAMAAPMNRHPNLVTHMAENVRQHDPGERAAVAHLRTGRIDRALDWYSANDRIRHRTTVDDSLDSMVRAWNDDVDAGRATTMLAWRRDHVAELNDRARDTAIAAGRVHGPTIDLGGIAISAGDQLVTLQPNRRLGLVTSERITVVSVDPDNRGVTAAAGDRTIQLTPDEASPGQLAYGYATTIHRAQGATFDICRLYADGGTHQLAYVGLTRARERTTIHCAAESAPQQSRTSATAGPGPTRSAGSSTTAPIPVTGTRAHVGSTPTSSKPASKRSTGPSSICRGRSSTKANASLSRRRAVASCSSRQTCAQERASGPTLPLAEPPAGSPRPPSRTSEPPIGQRAQRSHERSDEAPAERPPSSRSRWRGPDSPGTETASRSTGSSPSRSECSSAASRRSRPPRTISNSIGSSHGASATWPAGSTSTGRPPSPNRPRLVETSD